MLPGPVGQALATGMTHVECALVFFCFALVRNTFLAGRSVPMYWDRGAGSLDGLDTPSSTPQMALPGAWTTRPGMILRAIRGDNVCSFHTGFINVCASVPLWTFGDAQLQAVAMQVLNTPPGSLLLVTSWQSFLGVSCGAVPGCNFGISK